MVQQQNQAVREDNGIYKASRTGRLKTLQLGESRACPAEAPKDKRYGCERERMISGAGLPAWEAENVTLVPYLALVPDFYPLTTAKKYKL